MREQAVIAHANADVDGKDVEHGHHRKALPAEQEQCSKRASMKQDHERQREPVDALTRGRCTAHLDLLPRRNSVGRNCGWFAGIRLNRFDCCDSWDFVGRDGCYCCHV